jgi:hypothetical protein
VRKPDRHSIQVGAEVHLTPEGAPWSLVNHSCAPNVRIDFERWELVALRAIEPGEELGWNYLATEWELSSPFQCECGTDECLGLIRGFAHLDHDTRSALGPFVSPFIRACFAADLAISAPAVDDEPTVAAPAGVSA